MLVSSEILFNQAEFDRRLRHYFSDSAPCAVSYALGMSDVSVFTDPGEPLKIELDPSLPVEENIRLVIDGCEKHLYPQIAKATEETVPVPADEVTSLLNKGMSLIDIMDRAGKQKKRKWFVIIRVGLNNNTLVLRESGTEIKTVYELLYIPVLKYLERLRNGAYSPETAYDYLVGNSRIMALKSAGETEHGR